MGGGFPLLFSLYWWIQWLVSMGLLEGGPHGGDQQVLVVVVVAGCVCVCVCVCVQWQLFSAVFCRRSAVWDVEGTNRGFRGRCSSPASEPNCPFSRVQVSNGKKNNQPDLILLNVSHQSRPNTGISYLLLGCCARRCSHACCSIDTWLVAVRRATPYPYKPWRRARCKFRICICVVCCWPSFVWYICVCVSGVSSTEGMLDENKNEVTSDSENVGARGAASEERNNDPGGTT